MSVGGLLLQSSPWPLWVRIILPRHDLLGEERLTSLSEEKGVKPLSQWAFIGFSLNRDAYQRKEVWFTDNISGMTWVLWVRVW